MLLGLGVAMLARAGCADTQGARSPIKHRQVRIRRALSCGSDAAPSDSRRSGQIGTRCESAMRRAPLLRRRFVSMASAVP